jgi:CBS domain containing-hemolysin-like protein
MARLGHPAEVDDRVECDGYSLVAIDVAGRRVRRVRIIPTTEEEQPKALEDGSPLKPEEPPVES